MVDREDAGKETVIRIKCPLEDHKDEYVVYDRKFKFGDLRKWELANLVGGLAEQLTARAIAWKITSENKEGDMVDIPFVVGPKALDDVDAGVAAWMVASFREAYILCTVPPPKSS